jgi:hypothetical protein
VCLGIGALVAGLGVLDSIRLGGVEPGFLTLRRAGTCGPLLALTFAYAITALRAGTTRRALPFFAFSYAVLALTLQAHFIGITKGFAPGVPSIANYVRSYTITAAVTAVVVLLAVNQHRAARYRSTQRA